MAERASRWNGSGRRGSVSITQMFPVAFNAVDGSITAVFGFKAGIMRVFTRPAVGVNHDDTFLQFLAHVRQVAWRPPTIILPRHLDALIKYISIYTFTIYFPSSMSFVLQERYKNSDCFSYPVQSWLTGSVNNFGYCLMEIVIKWKELNLMRIFFDYYIVEYRNILASSICNSR